MNKETGSSIIGIIAIIAVAVLAGIWIGAKKDVIMLEVEQAPVTLQKLLKKDVQEVEVIAEELVDTTETEIVE